MRRYGFGGHTAYVGAREMSRERGDRVTIQCVSYDFAVLTPEAAGTGDAEALAAAVAVFEQEELATEPDRRLLAFVTELEAAGADNDDGGWVSVWPLGIADGGVAVPTTYADVDSNLVTLLRLAAGLGLVLVDLNDETVHPPAAGRAVGVMMGDGTRLGALTKARLESLLATLPQADPWLVLERGQDDYIQTYQEDDGSFLFERRDGSADRHYTTTMASRADVTRRMWAWLNGDPHWSADLEWEPVTL